MSFDKYCPVHATVFIPMTYLIAWGTPLATCGLAPLLILPFMLCHLAVWVMEKYLGPYVPELVAAAPGHRHWIMGYIAPEKIPVSLGIGASIALAIRLSGH